MPKWPSAMFDFEKDGRAAENLGKFLQLHKSKSTAPVLPPVYEVCILAPERNFILLNPCLEAAFPRLHKCAQRFTDAQMMAPFFGTFFRRPSPLLLGHLAKVRASLGLPPPPAGAEAFPGAWGLRSPGVYVLALHFRQIPLGFERMSEEIAGYAGRAERQARSLEAFWAASVAAAAEAVALCTCRGLDRLLIYFASDDPVTLRPEAQRRLGGYGDVVFGPELSEVGHMYPDWAGEKRALVNSEHHADISYLEWWIMAQSQWLIAHTGTAFSLTAAGVGLSHIGALERVDPELHAGPSVRRPDWEGDPCNDKYHATCPNNMPLTDKPRFPPKRVVPAAEKKASKKGKSKGEL